MRKNIKRYTAILLTIAMALPGSPVYGNMEDEYERLLEMENSEEYQKATDSNAQQKDESWQDDEDEEDLYEDEDLIDDLPKASPSDADEAEEADEVELEQDLETGKKLLSWEWNDEQDALINGELQLAVTAEDQVSFDDIVSMLPESITAEVREDGETTETEISVTGWKCEQYETDEDEKWPTEGTYLFEAEVPEEYELGAGADELSVKVTLKNPGMMLLTATTLEGPISINGTYKFELANGKYESDNGYTIEKLSNNEYKLILEGFHGTQISVSDGTWTIELRGENSVGPATGPALLLDDTSGTPKATITAKDNGSLEVSGSTDGIVVSGGTSLTIDGGTITANGGKETDSQPRTAGICVSGATLTINGGTIHAIGTASSKKVGSGIYMLYDDAVININGGQVTARGTSFSLDLAGKVTVSDGTLLADYIRFDSGNSNNNLHIIQSGKVQADRVNVCAYGGGNAKLDISGAEAELRCTGTLWADTGTKVTVENDGTLILETGTIKSGGTFTLNNGNFVLNGEFNNMDSIIYNGGGISGTGKFNGEKPRLVINQNSIINTTVTVGTSLDPGIFFKIPTGCGTLTYRVTDEAGNDTSRAHLENGEGWEFNADSVGTVILEVVSAETNFFASAKQEIELTIKKRVLNRNDITVTPYNGLYDGKYHNALTVKVDGKAPADDMVVQYRTVQNSQMSDYTSVMPQVKDCSDNSKYTYKVKISGENYETIEISVDDHVYIQPYNLSGAEVSLSSTEFTYNKNQQVPAVEAYINDSEVKIPESSYTVSYKKDDTACAKPTDAGTYQIVLTANSSDSNYTGTNADTKNTFEIIPKNLIPSITGTLTKTYNGDKNVNDDVKIVLKDGSDVVEGITAKASSITYDDFNAGDAVGITAMGIQIKGGNDQGNYALGADTAKAVGAIQKATLQDVCVEQDGELHYNGKEQSATTQTRATAPFGSSESVQFTYSLSENGLFAASVPAFKNEGNYTVFYKASCPNYKDYVDLFTVTILLGNLADATVTVGSDTSVYTGQEQTPSVEVKLGDVVLPETDYEVLYRWKDSVGGFVKPKDVGTYDMIIGGMNNMRGSSVHRTFTITEKSIEGNDILVSLSETDLPYDGDVKHPSVTVMDTSRGEVLIPGTDYTITMPDPVYPGEDYEITITGQGNYEGSKKAFYNVVKADLKDAAVTVSGTYVYQDSSVEPDGSQIAVVLNGKVVDPSEYEIAYADNAAIGTAKVLIQAKPDGNYVGSTSGTFEIRDPKAGQEDNRPGGSTPSGGSSSGGSGSSGGESSSSGSDRVTSASSTTKDSVKGSVSSDKGILTGANNSTANDGYSHWMQNEHGWWLRFADNSYPKAEKRGESGIAYAWEQINGNWWAFDENGYAGSGWLRDEAFGGWFYADPDTGMRTGWVMINGSWYYFHSEPDGKKGLMYAGQKTPDGYYVDENGAWDGKEN